MKKILFIIFAFILSAIVVNAAGPSQGGYIRVKSSYDYVYIYSQTETTSSVNGVSYDSSTNTLTFNGYNETFNQVGYGAKFQASNMGDLTVKFVGNNTVTVDAAAEAATTFVSGDSGTNLTIEGPGTITYTSVANNRPGRLFEVATPVTIDGLNIEFAAQNLNTFDSSIFDVNYQGEISINNANITMNSALPTIASNSSVISINNSTLDITNITNGINWFTITNILNSTINVERSTLVFGNINNSTININYGDLDDDYHSDSALIKDSDINMIGGSIELECKNVTIDGSTIKNKFPGSGYFGLTIDGYGVDDAVYTISNSVIELERASEDVSNQYFDLTGNSPLPFEMALIIGFGEGSTFELINDEVAVGGKLYSSCTQGLCMYYVAEEEIDLAGIYLRMANDNATQDDINELNKISSNVIIKPASASDEPAKEESVITEIIKKVPKTGISTVVSAVLGVQIIIAGVYILIKNTKKETI